MKVKINKYPYLLWLNYKKDLEIDLETKRIKSEKGESKIEKVANWKIFLMKYIPIFLVLNLFSIPKSMSDIKIFVCSVIVVFLSLFVLKRFTKYFTKYLISITVLGYYIIFSNQDLITITMVDKFITFSGQVIILAILIREIWLKKYTNYYYLSDVKKINTVNLAKKHNRPLLNLPFSKERGLFKVKRGFDVSFKIPVYGYYMRIEDEN